MTVPGYQQFLKTLPTHVIPLLPAHMQIKAHQPYRWLLQFYDQDRRVHYEVGRIAKRRDFELGLHFESKNKQLNQHLLAGFSRRMIEIHAQLGTSIRAEPWDRGWAKVYDIFPDAPLDEDFQSRIAHRLAQFIICVHPILNELYDTPVERNRVYSF